MRRTVLIVVAMSVMLGLTLWRQFRTAPKVSPAAPKGSPAPVQTRDSYFQALKLSNSRMIHNCRAYYFDSCLEDIQESLAAAEGMKTFDCRIAKNIQQCKNDFKLIASLVTYEDEVKKSGLMTRTDIYCSEAIARYGPAGGGLCDQAMDQAVGQVTGNPSAYDMCHAGAEAACEIALEHMSVSDPRYDEVRNRVYRPYSPRE